MKILGVGFHETYNAMPEHRDRAVELHYIIEGEANFECMGKRSRVTSGHFFAVFPNETHRIIPAGKKPYVRQYIISAEPDDELNDLAAAIRSRRYFFIGTNRRYFFEDIRRKWRANRHLALSAACALASLIHDCLGGSTVAADDPLEDALAYLQASVYGTVSLADIARRVGVPRERAIRLFKERTGMPPLKYFSLLKVEAAAGMLVGTDRSLEDIADAFSFTDTAHFSRMFKRYKGMTPGAYRRSRS